MGRFASTVEYYVRYREPYPPEFFAAAAARCGLTGRERLLDIGCGPAPLAIGFAPYVATCAGVDPEPAMLAAARAQASAAGVALDLIEGRVEELPLSIGVFELVTIGRALHWLDPGPARTALERLTAPHGAILMCGAAPVRGDANPWTAPYEAVRRAWTSADDASRYRLELDAWLEPTRFRVADTFETAGTHRVTVEELIGRALSKSSTSPDKLGPRRREFEREIAAALAPFARDGSVTERFRAVARIVRRAA